MDKGSRRSSLAFSPCNVLLFNTVQPFAEGSINVWIQVLTRQGDSPGSSNCVAASLRLKVVWEFVGLPHKEHLPGGNSGRSPCRASGSQAGPPQPSSEEPGRPLASALRGSAAGLCREERPDLELSSSPSYFCLKGTPRKQLVTEDPQAVPTCPATQVSVSEPEATAKYEVQNQCRVGRR